MSFLRRQVSFDLDDVHKCTLARPLPLLFCCGGLEYLPGGALQVQVPRRQNGRLVRRGAVTLPETPIGMEEGVPFYPTCHFIFTFYLDTSFVPSVSPFDCCVPVSVRTEAIGLIESP